MASLIKKQSFQKLTVILRVTGKLLLKSKDMCLNVCVRGIPTLVVCLRTSEWILELFRQRQKLTRACVVLDLHEHIYNKWLWHKLKQYRITDSWNDSGI
jgi:undecaprenyl pyrophosphate phosphatase UppP